MNKNQCNVCKKKITPNSKNLCTICYLEAPAPKEWTPQEQEYIVWFLNEVDDLPKAQQVHYQKYVQYFKGKPTDQDKSGMAIEALKFLRTCVENDRKEIT